MLDYETPRQTDKWDRFCWILIAAGYATTLLRWFAVWYQRTELVPVGLLGVGSLGIATLAFFVGLKAKGQMRRQDYLRNVLIMLLGVLSLVFF